jgi:thioredoxin-dependent adenylylsulfate APS reductase
VIVASFQAESSVLIDMACQVTQAPEVLTLDTGRLPEETHETFEAFLARFPIRLRVQMPDAGQVAELTGRFGSNLFYRSGELRRLCCEVRKARRLASALQEHDAWVTGLRRDQIETRRATPVVQEDAAHGGIAKIAPLAAWSSEQVWAYIRERRLPYHPLYDRGYTSIGCAPCTRAVRPGEDERAGRWWWEEDAVKECGLHWTPNGAVRARGMAT